MKMRAKTDIIEIEHCHVVAQTENATCFTFSTVQGKRDVWLPESQIEYWDDKVVNIPEWLAINKGIE